ncbi:MAG: TSUP family transporter, partial [Candidatus Binatia bacterium]
MLSESLASFGLPSNVLVWQAVFFTLLSFGVGIVGGAVGLALGTVRLPFLLLLGMPAPMAAGTNILVSTLSALTGSYRHFRERRVDLYVVAVQGI